MTSAVFDRQIRELSIRTVAYHEKCQTLWTQQPPPPHFGAPFLFAYIWSTWSESDRRQLIESSRSSVEQSIASMLSQGGGGGVDNEEKMQLLLACCVPEIFQDDLYEDLRPMAQLMNMIWKVPTKADRAAARQQRPQHISAEMTFIDRMPFVWAQPTATLIEQTLRMLGYRVFDAEASAHLSAADNEMYQRDLLLSLRAFWMSLFGLQVFMNLSDHFHRTEEMLLAKQRAEESRQADQRSDSTHTGSAAATGPAYRKPIHTMKIEEIIDEAIAVGSSDQEANAAAAAAAAASAAAAAANAATAAANGSTLSSGSAAGHCAQCHATPSVTLPSASSVAPVSSLPADPIAVGSSPHIDLKRCSRCRAVYYCSVQCQKKHFKLHKQACQSAAQSLQAAEAAAAKANLPVD